MVEFTLPRNSKVTAGKTWPKPDKARNVTEFRIYRWSPDDEANPRIDTYYVDTPDDIIYEGAGEGIDTVVSSVDYALGADLERVRLGPCRNAEVQRDVEARRRGPARARGLRRAEQQLLEQRAPPLIERHLARIRHLRLLHALATSSASKSAIAAQMRAIISRDISGGCMSGIVGGWQSVGVHIASAAKDCSR